MREIEKTYGVPKDAVRVFFHYQPQFWHLHVHFTSLKVDFGIETERAHLLDCVIDALERDPDHYACATLCYTLARSDPLMAELGK